MRKEGERKLKGTEERRKEGKEGRRRGKNKQVVSRDLLRPSQIF